MNRFNKSAQRLSLPGIDESELLQCIKSLVRLESQWIPSGVGYSLYVRPVMIATNECIGISQPDRAVLFVLCSPVGPYFKSTAGFTPVRLLAEDSVVRAWPGLAELDNTKLEPITGPQFSRNATQWPAISTKSSGYSAPKPESPKSAQ